jgi:predicted nucleic acid-binding protein
MSGKFFVDSNILVYAYNQGEPAKQALASNCFANRGD